MRRTISMRRRATAMGCLSLLAGAGPALAAPDAVLYELTENMAYDAVAQVRTATAVLQGTAVVGSPLCPDVLIETLLALGLIAATKPCTITAIGFDTLDLVSGTGRLSGTFATVINQDNPVDAAELVVMTGSFTGELERTGPDIPLLLLRNGSLSIETLLGKPVTGLTSSFSGVFRLPFARGTDAFYLGDDGWPIKVRTNELSLGVPTVRVDVSFGPSRGLKNDVRARGEASPIRSPNGERPGLARRAFSGGFCPPPRI